MSKLCPGIVRMIVSTALIAIASTTQAQPAPPVSAPLPSTKPQTPAVVTPTTAPTKQDLKLLSKAAGIFWQTDRSETESKVVLGGTSDGITINSIMQVKTIVQTGGKFRSQLTFTPIGSKVKATYTIVSNGKNVWIHRPDRNEYTKTTFTAFDGDMIFIGISSFMFLSVDEEGRQNLTTSLGTDKDLILNLNLPKPKDLQWANRQVDGINLSMYSFDIETEKAKIDIFLSPENANLHRIEFSSKEPTLDMNFSETIIKRSSQVNITDRTFTFIPPKGTRKVKSIKIAL